MKDLLKNKKLKQTGGLIFQCFHSISFVVEENYSSILNNATRLENRLDSVSVLEDENKELVIKVGNTKLTRSGLVLEVEESLEITEDFLKALLEKTLRDILSIAPPNQKYFSPKFKEIAMKEFE